MNRAHQPLDQRPVCQSYDDSPTVAIVRELEATLGTPMTELPPLAESVDPEAVGKLLRSNPDVELAFSHAGCEIEVSPHHVTVTREPDQR